MGIRQDPQTLEKGRERWGKKMRGTLTGKAGKRQTESEREREKKI